MRGTVVSRLLWRLLALLALAGTIQLAALPGQAWAGFGEEYTDGYEGDSEDGGPGPGTRWRECRNEAWSDYNECLMDDPDDTGNRAMCYFLWEADASYCDVRLVYDYLLPIVSFFK